MVGVVVELVVDLLALVRQSRWASAPTVLAPWARFARRVGLTVAGRLVTALLNAASGLRGVDALTRGDGRGD